jgi:hypothetical protein
VGLEEAESPEIVSLDWPEDNRFEGRTPVEVTVKERFSPTVGLEISVGDTSLVAADRANAGGEFRTRLLVSSRMVNGPSEATVRVRDEAGNTASTTRTIRPRNRETVVFGEESLPGCYGEIRDVARAPDGRLWVATGSGIATLEGDALQRYAASDPLGTCLRRGFAGIDVDADGTVWALAATPFEGLSIVRGRNGSFEEVRPFDPGRAVVVIDFFVRDGNFWLVTDQDILRARPDDDPQPVYEVENRLSNEILDADVASDGTLWIVQRNVVGPFQSGTVQPVSSETGGARVIRAVSDAEAWLGGGQTILHLTDGAVEASELPRGITPDICERPGTVRGLAPTQDGALWIGAGRSGGLRLTASRFFVYPGEDVGSEPCSIASRVRRGPEGSAYLFFESTGEIVYLGPGTF